MTDGTRAPADATDRADAGGDPRDDEARPDEERQTPKKSGDSKGAGSKHGVQPHPDDQRARPDPKEME